MQDVALLRESVKRPMRRKLASPISISIITTNKRQSAEYVTRSLLKQLVFQLQHKLPLKLDSAYEKYQRSGRLKRPDADGFGEIFISCCEEFSTAFVLIDAFDEFNEQEREKLLSYIQRFAENGVRIYITARQQFQNGLQQKFPTAKTLEIKADQDDVEIISMRN